MTDQFSYHDQILYAESVPLTQIAKEFGTPTYVYSKQAITEAFYAYQKALEPWPGTICYAVKANSNLAVLGLLANLGAGFDIVSVGELERVLAAGGQADKIVFSGVGKTRDEMKRALAVGVGCFNIESSSELNALADVAAACGVRAKISVRVNPDVDAQTHPYISTGLKENKFGVEIDQAINIYRQASALDAIIISGIDCHIGSQLTDTMPFLDALDRVMALADKLEQEGITIEHLDLGGGLGVRYNDESPPEIGDYISAIKEKLGDKNYQLMFEPGRSIVANAGLLLTKVEYLKPTTHRNFAIVDAAMNDNIRPSLYQAWQEIKPVEHLEASTATWDIVGPICETGDFLAKERELALKEGQLLAMMSSGAYGFTMSSNYNSRPRAAEVMVDGDKTHLIRDRETIASLFAGEHPLPESSLTQGQGSKE